MLYSRKAVLGSNPNLSATTNQAAIRPMARHTGFVEQRISSMRTANGPCLQVKYIATVADLNEAGFRAADVASSV